MRTKMKLIVGLLSLLAPPLIGLDNQAQAGEDGGAVVVGTDNHIGWGWYGGRNWGYGRGWGFFGGDYGYGGGCGGCGGYGYGYGFGDGCGCGGGGWGWYW